VTELFMQSFHEPIAGWCRRHDVQLSLEVDSTRNSVQRHAHIAGNDPGHEKVGGSLDALHAETRPRFRAHPRFPASLAAQVGLNRVLVESYHSIGWSLTFQDMKALADRLAAQGANLFVFHAFLYSLGGLRKWDAPPSQFLQNPYWPQFPVFTDYLGRLCYALSRGRRVSAVALLDPITSLWTHGNGAGSSIGSGPDAVAKRIAADWQYLQRELEAAQRPFDSLDPLLLSEGRVVDGALCLGDAEYHVIILPPLASLDAAAWDKLEEFADGGGTVIACGLLPYEQIEADNAVSAACAAHFGLNPATIRRAYARDEAAPVDGSPPALHRHGNFLFIETVGTVRNAQAAGALLAELEAVAPSPVVIQPVAGELDRRSFLVAQRRDGDELITFIANAGNSEQDCTITLRLPTSTLAAHGIAIERLDLEGGQRTLLAHISGDTASIGAEAAVRLPFPRYGSHLLLARPATTASDSAATPAAVQKPDYDLAVGLDGSWRCTLGNANALRLDQFRFGVVAELEPAGDAPPPDSTTWPLVEPKPFVNVLRDLEQAGQPWPLPVRVQVGFGSPAVLKLALPATAWYIARFDIATLPAEAVLCIETPALQGDWAVWLNGRRIPTAAFQARFRWDVTNQEVDVRPLLQHGENSLAVRVAIREATDGLVDALYLLGDFGVRAAARQVPVLTTVPAEVRWDHLAADGLPYFAGTLQLTKKVLLPAAVEEAVALRLPDDVLMYAGLAEVRLNGQDLGLRPWAPYRWQVGTSALTAGENEITVTLTTPLAGLLEGKRYDPQRRDTVRVEESV
ncbi:MAG TPA: hypothetical protein VIU62_21065, partial [Chloroflexota bacterium]